jgi:hypothetical protein
MKEKQIEHYIVYSNGTVWNTKFNKFQKPVENGKRLKLLLQIDGKQKWYFIHRLVAECFILNQNNKPTVNHIDGNQHNNDISNLEWATYSEQQFHSHRVLGRKIGGYCLKAKEGFYKGDLNPMSNNYKKRAGIINS